MKENYGRANARALKKLEKIAKLVEAKAELYSAMTDEELQSQTQILKDRYAAGETLDQLLPDAYAVCREASTRVLHQRHYHVQVLGGIALHQGRICQMATGEGKTLTETLPAYLNALTGNGVHIVTVNEYLATRDMEWMGKIFRFLGLTVGVTLSQMRPAAKREAYACDITYGTNSEFGFDYLRDNRVVNAAGRVQRGFNYAIIDEVDSILIDESRTPLIISAPGEKSDNMYQRVDAFVKQLRRSTNVDTEGNIISEEDEQEGFGIKSQFAGKLFGKNNDGKPNGDYVVNEKDSTVALTDSGILKAEERFGIKFQNEVKEEDVEKETTETNVSMDPDSLDKLSELTHYINNALRANALMKLDVDYIVERENGSGKKRIVLVDTYTGRKMPNRRFSKGLHQAIEAKEGAEVREEDKTVASVTYQNYFRMYRKFSGMTGTAKTEEAEFNSTYNIDVVVIPTNKPIKRVDELDRFYRSREYKLKAIVEEIKRRHSVGQPLLIGTVSVEKSEELNRLLKKAGIEAKVLNAKNHKNEAEIIAQAGRFNAVTIATNMAGRGTDILLGGNPEMIAKKKLEGPSYGYTEEQIEYGTSFANTDPDFDQLRKDYELEYNKAKTDTDADRAKVLSIESDELDNVKGLCVIGTEKHDSRRIDNQLRGRAGRQGDAGCSIFFISAEDDLMRIYGNDMMQGLLYKTMAIMGDESVPVESRMVERTVEHVQKRIEGLHFSSRKHVLQYDDVNNLQRKIIYKERNRILDGEDMHNDILDMSFVFCRRVLELACQGVEDVEKWNLDEVNGFLQKVFHSETPLLTQEDLTSAMDVCNKLTDYCKQLLDDKYNQAPEEGFLPFAETEKRILLEIMDGLWTNHIDELDEMRKGVGLQSIGQHDPLTVYKKEAFEMFEKLNEEIKYRTLYALIYRGAAYKEVVVQVVKENTNLSLNGPCPCGSGKKYKNCCYLKDQALRQMPTAKPDEQEPKPLTKQEEYALKRQQRKAEKAKK
ncbi:MAG: preprotein translocase subunit SecA [Clostridiales bacterium]|nr:preprotein translocase subunit SecA [Clostridiales bacterium]